MPKLFLSHSSLGHRRDAPQLAVGRGDDDGVAGDEQVEDLGAQFGHGPDGRSTLQVIKALNTIDAI